jgi:hypothetical protein
MNRAIGTLVTLTWLLAMGALIHRDILPFWQTQEPPAQNIPPGRFQVAISDQQGRRIGTTWVTTMSVASFSLVVSTTRLDVGALSGLSSVAGEMFVETELTYAADDTLDEFSLKLDSGTLSAVVSGARYGSEYACTATVGSVTRTLSFDGELSSLLGDSLRPFTYLKGLRVGQSWRLRLIDPLALLKSRSLEFTTQLVRVTRRETIQHAGRAVECHRIETDGTAAWADDEGRVLRQEVQIPFLGKWVITTEPFDEPSYERAKTVIGQLRERKKGAGTLAPGLGAESTAASRSHQAD